MGSCTTLKQAHEQWPVTLCHNDAGACQTPYARGYVTMVGETHLQVQPQPGQLSVTSHVVARLSELQITDDSLR